MMQLNTASLGSLHRRFRFSLFFLTTAVIQLACLAFELTVARTMTLLAASVLLNLVLMFGLTVCWVWGDPIGQSRQVRLVSVVWAALMVVAAITMQLGVVPVCLLGVAALAATYRFSWLYSSRSTSGVQRQFTIDTALLVFFAVFVGVGGWTHSFPPHGSQWVSVYSLLTLGAILGWVSVLWSYERSLSQERGGSRSGIIAFLTFAVLCGLFGLKAVYNTLLFLLGAFGVLLQPVTRMLPSYKASPKPVKIVPRQAGQMTKPQPPLVPRTVWPHTAVHIAAIVITVIAAVTLCAIIFRRKSAPGQSDEERVELAVVSRHTAARDEDLFLPTNHPVRLRLQQWLRHRVRLKDRLHPADTVKQWAAEPEVDDETRTMMQMYERIRYREDG